VAEEAEVAGGVQVAKVFAIVHGAVFGRFLYVAVEDEGFEGSAK